MIEVEILRAGEEPQLIPDATSIDIKGTILSRARDADTTITITDTLQDDRQILVSLSDGLAFVGLVLDDQQFQLAQNDVSEERTVVMIIGGQATSIAERFAVEPTYAALAATVFVTGDPMGDTGLNWIAQ